MAIHHFVSRAVEVAAVQKHGDDHPLKKATEIPKSALAVVLATFAAYMVLHLAISYTYGLLVPNLVMAEAPSQTTVIKTTEYRDETQDESENPDAPLLTKEEREFMTPRDEEVLVITHKPLTASFRTIITHLREKTGSKASRFRGVGGLFVYNMLACAVSGTLGGLFPNSAVMALIQFPATALLCLFHTAWVQQTVAMPGMSYFQRVSELRRNGAFGKLFLPVMAVEMSQWAVISLPANLMVLTGHFKQLDGGRKELIVSAAGTALAVFTFLFYLTFIVIPFSVALVRLQVALLPEETETVVSVDRTLGGADLKTMRSAIKSISRDTYKRLVKTWVKVFCMQTVLTLVAITAVVFELKTLAGPQLKDIVESGKQMYRQ